MKGFLHRIVTGDENWVRCDNTKRQVTYGYPGHASSSTAKPNIHGEKTMLCIWWDQLGVVYYELLQPNERITGEAYRRQLMHGAPPHYHRDVRAYLDKNLSGQWIGRRGPIEFPARSPDLTPLDFFLWGTVKDGVYKRKPRNLDILWNEIQAVCREILLDVLIRCTESVVTRTQNCIDAAGHQFEQY
ncbi:hypothetical protein LAZ67_18000015 [Cordylochernes scorpioides]|uniref:Mariner Mos1 transposase n=1 Tax=Cordylochernes scorpioides TaxID=51811 RepID=A0ABY6LH70_9ARAC|nr:hypothetical protein LAZ67_18000015 [Cordylochernes scorpioides]